MPLHLARMAAYFDIVAIRSEKRHGKRGVVMVTGTCATIVIPSYLQCCGVKLTD